MAKISKKIFTVFKNKEDEEYSLKGEPAEQYEKIELAVRRPSYQINNEAQLHYNRKFRELVDAGTYLEKEIGGILQQRKLWTPEKQKEYDVLIERLRENEKWVKTKAAPGEKKTKKQLREKLLQMKIDRSMIASFLTDHREYEQKCAEGQSETAKFNYLIYRCTVYNDTGKEFFAHLTFEEFMDSDNMVVINEAGIQLAKLLWDADGILESEKKLPENQLLLKYGFCDDNLRLINDKKQFVDFSNKVINEDGRYVNENNQFVDFSGNLVDKDGNLVSEEPEFVDD